MTENVTSNNISDEAADYVYEEDDWSSGYAAHINLMYSIDLCYLPFLIVTGITCNTLALVVLMRRRLWLYHEAYIYLAAILVTDIVKVTFDYGNWFLNLYDDLWSMIAVDFLCKFWSWLVQVVSRTQWLHVLMLLNVRLRQQLNMTSSDRRGCFMNLAAKYCSLLGTKFIVISFFIVSALANLWHFWTAILRNIYGNWSCFSTDGHSELYNVLSRAARWLEIAAFLSVIVLLVLVVCKRRRIRSGFAFSQMNGVSQDNGGDAEAMVRIVVICTAVVAVLKAPLHLTHLLHELGFDHRIYKVVDALQLISFAYPLPTPIVLFSVKSRFRDELRTIVLRCCVRCCPRASCHGITLSPDSPDSDRRTSDLQMNPIDDESSVAGIAEDSRSYSVDKNNP